MAGETTTVSLSDALPVIVASARQVREQPGGFVDTVDRKPLPSNSGTSWREFALSKLTAQAVGSQTTRLNTPQDITGTLFAIEAETIGIHTIVTAKVKNEVSGNVWAQVATLMQHAIQRKKEIDGFALYDGASFSQPGAGNVLTEGVLSAIFAQIKGNTTEPGIEGEPVYAWLHAFQMHDLNAELKASVGTYTIQPGPTADAYNKGFQAVMMVGGCAVKVGGNIRIDGSDDAHGGVHTKSGIVLVEENLPKAFNDTLKDMGGAEAAWLYDTYAYGERSSGTMFGRVISDAVAPVA